ncbi:MAG: SpoIID/LytB domain-containing protein [Candidatus Bruticola sp.]
MKIKSIITNSSAFSEWADFRLWKSLGPVLLLVLFFSVIPLEAAQSPQPSPTPAAQFNSDDGLSAEAKTAAAASSRRSRHKLRYSRRSISKTEKKAAEHMAAPEPSSVIIPLESESCFSTLNNNGVTSEKSTTDLEKQAAKSPKVPSYSFSNLHIAQLEDLSHPIRVLIYQGRGPVTIGFKTEPSPSFCPPSYKGGAGLVIDGCATDKRSVELGQSGADSEIVSCASGSILQVGASAYRGCIRVERRSGILYLVNCLALEDYLRGVIPKELLCSAPEAMKAQAVAARTYAWARRCSDKSWDVDCSTNSQVYGGALAETIQSDRAILDTVGQVLAYNGTLAGQTLYHSACGGHTESPLYIYGAASAPYLVGVDCIDEEGGVDCAASSYYSWQARWSEVELGQELSEYFGKKLGPVSGLEIVEQGPSGRVSKLCVHFQNGASKILEYSSIRSAMRFKDASGYYRPLPSTKFVVVSGVYIQAESDKQQSQEEVPVFGQVLNLLEAEESTVSSKSEGSAAELKPEPGCIVISGQGWGHGVGMCQWGSIGMAKRGQNYLQILSRYFTGTQVCALESLL